MRIRISMAGVFLGIAVLWAGSAWATDADLEFTDAFSQTSPNAVIVGNDVSGLMVGDRFEVSIFVDNTNADAVADLFTFINIDPTVLTVVQAAGAAILQEPGFGGNVLAALAGFGNQAVGQPAGTLVGLAHGVVGPGTSSAPLRDQAVVLVFELLSATSTTIGQSESGNSTINGIDQGPMFGPGITVTVPEPTSLMSSLAALGTMSGVIAIRRRDRATA